MNITSFLFICLFLRMFVCPYVRLSVCPFVRMSVCLFVFMSFFFFFISAFSIQFMPSFLASSAIHTRSNSYPSSSTSHQLTSYSPHNLSFLFSFFIFLFSFSCLQLDEEISHTSQKLPPSSPKGSPDSSEDSQRVNCEKVLSRLP